MSQNDLMNGKDASIQSTRSPLTIAVGQFSSVDSVDRNLDTMDRLAAEAALAGSDLVVFPEASMYQWSAPSEEIAAVAQKYGDQFVEGARAITTRHGVAVIAGSYARNDTGDKPFNRLTAIDSAGQTLSVYDKVHLYDAYSWRESDTVAAGPIHGAFEELGVFDLKGWRIGMLNCYDLRFPEITRGLTERGADIITMSSAWVVGPLKEFHLSTLAAARAIETTSYVAIANQGGEVSTGRSSIVSPFGNTLATVDLVEAVAIATIRDDVLAESRSQLPIRVNRRYAVGAQAITG
ncbi:MAG: nitrilase-related carbon-nitrogen hydrolase [Gulosibacter sp.]|uniref:nitrilase-related carbon-nitrogen hydrolase n=1 Tax=Gulosibacter sp. TaxID=2817531 RepID=UPI003F91C2E8